LGLKNQHSCLLPSADKPSFKTLPLFSAFHHEASPVPQRFGTSKVGEDSRKGFFGVPGAGQNMVKPKIGW